MSGNFQGTVTFERVVATQQLTMPAGSVADDQVKAGAAIDGSKVLQRVPLRYAQANGADVASKTELLHVCRAAGKLIAVEIRVTTAPTGGDKQFTVDVQKASDASGVWTSLLTSVVTIDATDADETRVAGTLVADPSTAAGAAIRVVVTASGSTGTQGQGVLVVATYQEAPPA